MTLDYLLTYPVKLLNKTDHEEINWKEGSWNVRWNKGERLIYNNPRTSNLVQSKSLLIVWISLDNSVFTPARPDKTSFAWRIRSFTFKNTKSQLTMSLVSLVPQSGLLLSSNFTDSAAIKFFNSLNFLMNYVPITHIVIRQKNQFLNQGISWPWQLRECKEEFRAAQG
jgi:hypothetical protein